MSKRSFEFVEGSSSKFWEVWMEGSEVRTRYGKIGTAGQTTIKDEGDEAKAKKLYDKLVAEKTKKGYVEVGGASAPAASAPAAPAASAPAAAPAAKAAKGKAFDPKKYAAAIAKITAAAKKKGFELPPGATAEEIEATEETLGVTFPDEMRAFYLTHNGGSDDEIYNCNGRYLLPLDGIVSEWQVWKELLDKGTFKDNDHGVPGEGVQKKWWIPEWIPVTYDGSGNHDIVDLAPGEGGKVGQIIDFWHDDDPRNATAPDLLTWLAKAKWTEDEDEEDDEEGSAWRRFEVDEKFWAIKRDGASFTVKYGKIGTDGQEKTKDFDDEEAAEKEYDKLVAEKTKKGYEEVDSDD
jgi:predicted DNA-binding WGR domain protein/cell wall assembly regulator SMI1